MARKSPNALFEKITTVRDGWEDLAREESFGGMTAEEYSTGVSRSVNIRNEIMDLENQLTSKMQERDALDAENWDKAKFVVAGVAANPWFRQEQRPLWGDGLCPFRSAPVRVDAEEKGQGRSGFVSSRLMKRPVFGKKAGLFNSFSCDSCISWVAFCFFPRNSQKPRILIVIFRVIRVFRG